MAKTGSKPYNAKDDPAAAGRLAQEVLNTVKQQAGEGRIWFPNGIDSLTLSVSVSAQGASFSLAVAGPKGASALAEADRLAVFAVGEQLVMDASREAGKDAANLKDCNKFVKNVASRVGITIDPAADADGIVDIINAGPWTPLPKGDNAAAMAKAAEGKLVIAGIKKADFTVPRRNGHVVVVHGHEVVGFPGFPHASWGSLDGTGTAAGTVDGSLRDTFRKEDFGKINYSFRDL